MCIADGCVPCDCTVQVYLVAGGYNDNFDGTDESISPTELLVEGIPSWTNADPLPWAVSSGLQAVSIDNTVITTGQCISLVNMCIHFTMYIRL